MLERRDEQKLRLTSEEAADWLIRLHDQGLDATERQQYLEWLKVSPQNTAEALRMGRVFAALRARGLEPGLGEARGAEIVSLPSPLRRPAVSPSLSPGRWKIAAGIAALAISTASALMLKAAWIDRTVETAASEWQARTLSDGSLVRVGPRTKLSVDFDDGYRFVHLARGEALFEVTKDPARPFVVGTGLATVRVTGTQFGVSRTHGEVTVTVKEGTVDVSRGAERVARLASPHAAGSATEGAVVTLMAGEQVTVADTWPVAARRVDAAVELAWALQRLSFAGASVPEAVDAFNRRNRLQIRIDDGVLASKLVNGVFDAADPEAFARFLTSDASVTIVNERLNILRIQRVPAGERPASIPPEPAMP